MCLDGGNPVSGVGQSVPQRSILLQNKSNSSPKLIFDWNSMPSFDGWNIYREDTTPEQGVDSSQQKTPVDLTPPPELEEKYVCPKDATNVVKVIPEAVQVAPKAKLNLPKTFTINSNITQNLFDGTAEDLNKILAKTPLKGMGQAFIDAQNKYGVSALFLMGVAKVESGYGAKPTKKCKYNVVGAIGQIHTSYADSINHLASNIKRNYLPKLNTPDKIHSKYCKTNGTWAGKVAAEMSRISQNLS